MYQRIISEDEALLMPPADSKLFLNGYEKKLIKKWIQQGAKFEKHWAYRAPVKAVLPKSEASDWGHNEIDAFVLAKLEDNNLKPSKQANFETLIRRISLDITGLPPKQNQLKELLSDKSEKGLEKAIDIFLAAPAYGERMTQAWLDVARYADSHGYQDDNYRSMWPWRDWVIHAFNTNVPYDEFLTWQLAGDLLPNATQRTNFSNWF